MLTAGQLQPAQRDGAAALVIASEKAVEEHGADADCAHCGRLVGRWRIVGALSKRRFPPCASSSKKTGHAVEDFDLVENNEAFALNSVLFNKVLQIPHDKMNVYGGGIALGHPIGCTGARLIVTLLTGLLQRDGKLGLASLCHGTGGGTAVAVELV